MSSPELYGRPEYTREYGLKEIIPERDYFEFAVIRHALDQKKPILGICRGLQVMNVYLGGTLIPDIPALLHSHFHGKISGSDQPHMITIVPDSLLQQVSGAETGLVNSAHHQSADRPGKDLKVTAFGDTDVVEAMEWKKPGERSWLLLIQWHPERMPDQTSPLTQGIRNAFLEASRSYRTTNENTYLNPALHASGTELRQDRKRLIHKILQREGWVFPRNRTIRSVFPMRLAKELMVKRTRVSRKM